MSKTQVQVINDCLKMIPRLSLESLESFRRLMEKEIDAELLELEPTIILKNMDLTEKVMYLDYLKKDEKTKEKEINESISLEDILNREGLTIDDLQDND